MFGAAQIPSGLHSLQLIVDEPLGSFQIGDESHVSVIPGSFFPDSKDGCGMDCRQCIASITKANKPATLA